MKKILVSILTLCFAAMSVQVSAEAYTDEQGVVYDVTGVVGKVTGYVGKLPNVVISSPVKKVGTDDEFDVTIIGQKAFKENKYLESIVLPSSIVTIEDSAFLFCEMLYRVHFDGKIESSELGEIKTAAFYGCTSLIDINIPARKVKDGGEWVTNPYIRKNAFYKVLNVTYPLPLNPPPSGYNNNGWGISEDKMNCPVEGYLVFVKNSNKSIVKLCSPAARGSIVVPDGVTEIQSSSQGGFYNCSLITSLILPESLTLCGSFCFSNCSGLQSIVSKNPTPPDVNHSDAFKSFIGVNKDIPVYVPEGSISTYQNAKGWDQFNNYQAWSQEQEDELSKCTLTLGVNDESMGSVTGAGTYDGGSDVKIEAKANEGFVFVQWSDGVTENPRTLKVTSDMTLTAIFKDKNADPDKFLVSLMVSDPNAGEVTGAGSYALGETVIIEAKAKDGYKFVNWSDGNTSPVRTIIIDKNLVLTANFEAIGASFTITVSVNDPTMGIVQGAGKYAENAQVKLLAIPNTGFDFVKWSDGDTSNPRVFVATKDSAFVAEFAKKEEPEPKPEEGLDGVQSTEYRVQKVFIDGQLYIMYEGTMYDVQGNRVK